MIKLILSDAFRVVYPDEGTNRMKSVEPRKAKQLRAIYDSSDLGELHYDDYLEQVADVMGKTKDEIAAEEVTRSSNQELLDYFKNELKNFQVAMLTNVNYEFFQELIDRDDLDSYFSPILISSLMGLKKPDPDIFIATQQVLGVKFEEIFFIDDREENINAAKSLGMQALKFTDNESVQKHIDNL